MYSWASDCTNEGCGRNGTVSSGGSSSEGAAPPLDNRTVRRAFGGVVTFFDACTPLPSGFPYVDVSAVAAVAGGSSDDSSPSLLFPASSSSSSSPAAAPCVDASSLPVRNESIIASLAARVGCSEVHTCGRSNNVTETARLTHVPVWSTVNHPHTFLFMGVTLCGHRVVPTSLAPWLLDMGHPSASAGVAAASVSPCLELPVEYVRALAAWVTNVTCPSKVAAASTDVADATALGRNSSVPASGSLQRLLPCWFSVDDSDAPLWPPPIEVLLGTTAARGAANSSTTTRLGTLSSASSTDSGLVAFPVRWADLLMLQGSAAATQASDSEFIRLARGMTVPLCVRATGSVAGVVFNTKEHRAATTKASARGPRVLLGSRTWRRRFDVAMASQGGDSAMSLSELVASFTARAEDAVDAGGGASSSTADSTSQNGCRVSVEASCTAATGAAASQQPGPDGAPTATATTTTTQRRLASESLRFVFASDKNKCLDARCVNLLYLWMDAAGECHMVQLVSVLIFVAVAIAAGECAVALLQRYVQRRVLEESTRAA